MRKIEQERLLKLLNEKAKLKEAYAELDKQILRLAHTNGPNSIVIEVDESMRKAYPALDLEDKNYFRMSLIDNMAAFSISESEDETPVTLWKAAKFTRFEIEGKGLKNKPKDM